MVIAPISLGRFIFLNFIKKLEKTLDKLFFFVYNLNYSHLLREFANLKIVRKYIMIIS